MANNTIDSKPSTPTLDRVDNPSSLRQLKINDLPGLSDEIRQFLLHSLNETGGHLGSSLGAIDITIALHYVFNTPHDRIVWDVGHQAYAHKILTERKDQFPTLRQTDGLCPFPHRNESKYDTFGVGHSSTSISAALGMALAARQQGIDRHCIAVIGDGAMTAGLAFEAINHAGGENANMIIILNDNCMSISENVGGLSNRLANIVTSDWYQQLRQTGKKVLHTLPKIPDIMQKAESQVKGLLTPSALFEQLGCNYAGPIDGHNIEALCQALQYAKKQKGVQLLHVLTKKGCGYEKAEDDPIKYHGVSKNYLNNKPKAEPVKNATKKQPTYSNIFGQWIIEAAEQDENVIAITPAMREGSDLVEFEKRFPERYFDVGIAEQHALTLAAGMATDGLKPVVAIYSTFLQRAYDQLIHDCALQNLPVLLAIDRAGVVGGDGATHNGVFDVSYLRAIPNVTIMAPKDEQELRQMLSDGLAMEGVCAVRYPRGCGPGVAPQKITQTNGSPKAEVIVKGHKIAILAFGSMVQPSLEVGKQLNATVVNMRYIKPLDISCLKTIFSEHEYIITVEEHAIMGGCGSAVNECMQELRISKPIYNIGIPDLFIEHGTPSELLDQINLNRDGILKQIQSWLDSTPLTCHSDETMAI